MVIFLANSTQPLSADDKQLSLERGQKHMNDPPNDPDLIQIEQKLEFCRNSQGFSTKFTLQVAPRFKESLVLDKHVLS